MRYGNKSFSIRNMVSDIGIVLSGNTCEHSITYKDVELLCVHVKLI